MSPLITASSIALAALAVIALLYHAITEHHVHRRIVRIVNPGTVVPETRHDTRWHGLSHGRRLGADLAIVAAAGCLGVAWRIAPAVTLIACTAALVAVIVLAATRSLSKVIGARPRTRGLQHHDRTGTR